MNIQLLFEKMGMKYLQESEKVAKEQKIEVEGKVIDVTHDIYTVELDNKVIVTARVSGKIRLNMIRILAGDRVTVEMSPTDLTHGIIKFRK